MAPTLNKGHLDDLTATKLCAEAMGIEHRVIDGCYVEYKPGRPALEHSWSQYRPLHDDAQAMALVKRFRLNVHNLSNFESGNGWNVFDDKDEEANEYNADLNRAIVYCVAAMQSAPIANGADK